MIAAEPRRNGYLSPARLPSRQGRLSLLPLVMPRLIRGRRHIYSGGRTAGRACSHIPVRWISPSASSRRVLTQPPAPRRRQLQRCPRGFVRGSGLVRSPLPLPRRTGSVTSVGGNHTPMPQSARRGVLAECPHVFLMVAETLSWCVPTSSSLQSSRQI